MVTGCCACQERWWQWRRRARKTNGRRSSWLPRFRFRTHNLRRDRRASKFPRAKRVIVGVIFRFRGICRSFSRQREMCRRWQWRRRARKTNGRRSSWLPRFRFRTHNLRRDRRASKFPRAKRVIVGVIFRFRGSCRSVSRRSGGYRRWQWRRGARKTNAASSLENAIGNESETSAGVSGTCRGGCGGRREGGDRVCWRVVSKDADSRWVSSEY